METKKILVITNDDDVFAKLHFEFDAAKYVLQRLSNPLLSIEVLNNSDYYAVVADLSMKEIFMVDMFNNIGFIHTNMPVVLLSSHITADDILLAYEFGFLEILPKDYKKGEIKKTNRMCSNKLANYKEVHMKPVKKILFPTDFSEASHYALAYAVEMKKILGAELEIVHILFDEGNIVAFYIPQMGMPMQNLSPDFEDGARKQFDEFVANAPELKDVEFTTKILRGNPYSEIIKEAENGNFDMIIIGTHGRTGLEHVLFGSTAELVVRKAPCPVLTVRPKGTQEA